MTVRDTIRLILASAALCAAGSALAQQTTTPITNVIVLFQENVSFDHYFGTYPARRTTRATRSSYPIPVLHGQRTDSRPVEQQPEHQQPGQRSGITQGRVNPMRLSPAQAYTCSQNHNYGPEQQAVDSGLMDKFPLYTGRNTSEGCAADGSTVLGYFDGNTVAALWNYAQNYAMNDNSFGSTFGPSSPGAINLVSGRPPMPRRTSARVPRPPIRIRWRAVSRTSAISTPTWTTAATTLAAPTRPRPRSR